MAHKEVDKVEITGASRVQWSKLPIKRKDEVLSLPFVKGVSSHWITIHPGFDARQIESELIGALRRALGGRNRPGIKLHYTPESPLIRLERMWRQPEKFKQLDLGADVAEREEHLLEYFISTRAFHEAQEGTKTVIIGPKGSGKSAILRALSQQHGSNTHAIVITPETFATSVLQQFVENSKGLWQQRESFTSAWIFTILFEVFRRASVRPTRAKKSLRKIREFLLDHSQYQEFDLFTRFVHRLSRIEAIKLGDYEISIKTRELQKLHGLADLYSLIPDLRKVLSDEIVVLIDELDEGWDNSEHANDFVAALMMAAIRVQSMGLRVRMVAFLRSEIFDIVKSQIDHLDKLRSSIGHIKWRHRDLAALVIRRIAYSIGAPSDDIDVEFIHTTFPESLGSMSGFNYMVSRTSRRPREILQFIRLAHSAALEGRHAYFTRRSILVAEEEFSRWKLEHVCTEYRWIFPGLEHLLSYFRESPPILTKEQVTESVSAFLLDSTGSTPEWAPTPIDAIQIMYQVEFLGIKTQKPESHLLEMFDFAYDRPTANVRRSDAFMIHPAFWSSLEIRDPTVVQNQGAQ